MSSQDGSSMDMETAMASDDIPMSPISAADMLNRSRRTSRRTLTSTPAKRLFPDNIDVIAPGMTPTSRNQRRRKSQGAGMTPRRSARLSAAPSSGLADTPGPSSRTIDHQTIAETSDMQLTPIATPMRQSSPIRPPRTPVQPLGRRQARESDDTTGRVLSFGGWGSGREESPMEMLRRLAQAPGQLSSPIDERNVFMPSISERLDQGVASRERAESQSQASSSRGPPPRHSAANTSMASSEVGQGRRVARQSARDNLFSDLLQQEPSANLTNRKSDAFTLRGDFTNVPIEEESTTNTSRFMNATSNREEELEQRIADESTRHVNGFNTSPNLTRRLESLSASFDQYDDSEMQFDNAFAPRTPTRTPRREDLSTRSPIGQIVDDQNNDGDQTILAGDQGAEEIRIDTTEESERHFAFKQANGTQDESNEIGGQIVNSDDSSEEEEEILDQSKEVRAARMALLRRRRAKKKARRVSSITGNAVPSLSSDLVKSLFTTFATPNAAISSAPSNKGKIKVGKAAAEAVEDLSHLFFAQFSQALITQAEESGKTRIMEKDIVSLMKSQGQISSRNSLSFLARQYLPRELSDLITSTTANDATNASRRAPSRKRKVKAEAEAEVGIEDTMNTTQE